jgi:hypothetical protein
MLGHGEYYEEGPEEVVRDALLHRPIWDIFSPYLQVKGRGATHIRPSHRGD